MFKRKKRRGPPAGSGLLCSGAPAVPPASWQDALNPYGDRFDPAVERARATNPAEAAFFAQDDRIATKWHHYLEIYDRHLSRYRGKPVRVLELGVYQGGSLQMWRRYFGPEAVIHGLDINGGCRQIEDEQPDLRLHLGSQADQALLKRIVEEMGGIDVVIDDAGHVSPEQILSFETLYPLMAPDGVYIVEDLHASYWPEFGGGLRAPGAFMEYAKHLLDRLHARYVLEPEPFTRDPGFADATHGIAFYDSMVVFERRRKPSPRSLTVGRRTLS
ncbi:class I SAM-dependent methyltransferase [Methylorubrum salsuginis]|uniref:Methyltransferase domain-containing protein n=1 Tax=Methylorubrum salsuginis TaxID=414703 RepID=A0A1I4I2I9_9HYPH|nr:class I SAM-dependent methyltransferase [Methylorubrum salsuginis]SFL48484.1 Methyltransferase domain-containing protein [Methylorubrum salsuginis]